jgi:hypothetical protein
MSDRDDQQNSDETGTDTRSDAATDESTSASPDSDADNLGTEGTIPNSTDGIALGHDPEGSHFNPEEDATALE